MQTTIKMDTYDLLKHEYLIFYIWPIEKVQDQNLEQIFKGIKRRKNHTNDLVKVFM